MPTLTGTLADVTGDELDPADIRSVSVRAPAERPSLAGGDVLIVSAPVDLARSGVLSVALEPGPAVLVVVTDASRDVYELHVTADMTLLSEALAESSPDRSWVESVMVQLRAEAVAAAGAAAEDRVQTGLDRVATGEDREQTGLDRVATGEDRVATGQDRQQTGLDRVAAETARGDAVDAAGDVAATVAQFDVEFAADMAQFAGIRDEMNLTATTVALDANRAEAAANEFGLTATSSTLAPGAAATVTVSGDGPAYSLAFGVPQGPKGDKGDPGEVTTSVLTTALAGKADLVGGQVPTSQLPAVALSKPSPVADRAGMLALTAEEGDVAVVTGGADKGTYMLSSGPANVFSSWVKLTSPDAPVQSVNGQTGTVNLNAANVGARPSSYVPAWDEVTSKPVTFPPATHQHGVTDMTATGTRSASTFLRGDNTWGVPAGTTYTAMPIAEAQAGTATTSRTMRADVLKQTINHFVTGSTSTDVSATGKALAAASSAAVARSTLGAVAGSGAATGLWIGTASSLPATGTSGVLYVTY